MRLLVPVVLIALAGCSAPAGAADVSTANPLDAGRKLYVAKCARCHKLYDPNKYSDAAWDKWMAKMTRKAKLKPDQADLISRYVATLRDGANTNVGGASSAPRVTSDRP